MSRSQPTSIIIPPITSSSNDDPNTEPQFVSIRAANNGIMFLDSMDKLNPYTSNQTDYILARNSLLLREIKRFAVESVQYPINIPNVNTLNNQIIFHSAFSGQDHTVYLTTGFYNHADLAVNLQNALNTVQATSGINFTVTEQPHQGNVMLISSPGPNWYFNGGNIFNPEGKMLLALPTDTALTVQRLTGYNFLTYTRWFSIFSFQLHQYDKNPSSSTKFGPQLELLARVMLTDGRQYTPGTLTFFSVSNLRWVNFLRGSSLSSIDFKIYDEFGNPLQLPANWYFPVVIDVITEL